LTVVAVWMPEAEPTRNFYGVVGGELEPGWGTTGTKPIHRLDEQAMVPVPVVSRPYHEVALLLDRTSPPKVGVNSHVKEVPAIGRNPPTRQDVELRRRIDVDAGG